MIGTIISLILMAIFISFYCIADYNRSMRPEDFQEKEDKAQEEYLKNYKK